MTGERADLDTLSIYSKIVGIDGRRLPTTQELPSSVILPSVFLGSFFDSIRNTIQDGRERGQSTLWNKSTQCPNYTDLNLGSKNRINSIREVLRALFGPKALFHYHTHPRSLEDRDPTWHKDFSLMDIARMKALPGLSYISAVGSDLGGVFVLQSDKSAQFPIHPLVPYLKTWFDISVDVVQEGRKVKEISHLKRDEEIGEEVVREVMVRVTDKIRISRGGRYLEESGLGCYIWTPTTSLNENPTEIILERYLH